MTPFTSTRLGSARVVADSAYHASHKCDAREPRIGRYKVTPELLELWSNCEHIHYSMKSTRLALRFKSRTLTIHQFQQYLIDRIHIFSYLEQQLRRLVLINEIELAATRLFPRLCRAQSAVNSLPPGAQRTRVHTKPSNAAQQLVVELEAALQSCSAEARELLEWHCFVVHAELWFGGTVHAKAVELMMRDHDEWRSAYSFGSSDETIYPDAIQKMARRATALWTYGDDTPTKVSTRFKLAEDYFELLGNRLSSMTLADQERATELAAQAMQWGLRLFDLEVYA